MAIAQNYPNIVPSLSLDFANVKALDPRITFARASTATYYGTETAKAEENLLLQSQTFDNAVWAKVNTTVTANTTVAPDGTTTADTLTATAGNAAHQCINISSISAVIGLTYTQSIFVKKGTLDFLQLTPGSAPADMLANFNLTTGAIELTGAGLIGATTSTIGDFFRFTITFVSNSTGNNLLVVNMVDSGSATRSQAFNAVGTETVILWGGQHEQRSAVTAYTPTTTQPITNFIPVLESEASGVARFDHNPVTKESLGLLIEEQRTNLLTYSEEFDDASWIKNVATVTANQVIAPDGTLTGDKLVMNSGVGPSAGGAQGLVQISTVTSGTYTISVFAKAGEFTGLRIREQATLGSFLEFDLLSGIAPAGSAQFVNPTIISVGNGWYRCSWTSPANMTNINKYVFRVSETGDGFSGIFIWGASLEQGAFSTSYIPTVASQVTRAADAASMTGANFSSWYNQAEGTLYGEFATTTPTTARAYQIGDGTVANRMDGLMASNTFSVFVNTNNSAQVNISTPNTLAANTFGRVGFAYKTDDFACFLNAGSGATDTSALVPVVNQIGIGRRLDTTAFLNGTIKRISYYPVRVTNEQLQGLTT